MVCDGPGWVTGILIASPWAEWPDAHLSKCLIADPGWTEIIGAVSHSICLRKAWQFSYLNYFSALRWFTPPVHSSGCDDLSFAYFPQGCQMCHAVKFPFLYVYLCTVHTRSFLQLFSVSSMQSQKVESFLVAKGIPSFFINAILSSMNKKKN